jgi:hypothetical protein
MGKKGNALGPVHRGWQIEIETLDRWLIACPHAPDCSRIVFSGDAWLSSKARWANV